MSTSAALARRAHYFSAACIHEDHDACVGSCEFCESPCQCACHGADDQAMSATDETLVAAGTITTTEATT